MKLVVLYGAPGVGKLTVARELAAVTGYKVFHNHLTVDLVLSVFPFGTEQFERLSTMMRLAMFEEAAKANVLGVIFTLVYAAGVDDSFIQQIRDSVEPFGGEVNFVLLTCDSEVLRQRVAHESRAAFGKLRDPEVVEELFAGYHLATPVPHAPSLVIDNTDVSPSEVAARIKDWMDTP